MTGFFYFLRASNLTVTKFTTADYQMIRRQDISLTNDYVWISTSWSKTNSFRDRALTHATARMRGHPLCLHKALSDAFSVNGTRPIDHAFAYRARNFRSNMHRATLAPHLSPLITKAGHDPSKCSLHSLRAGGATFAFEFGLPNEAIQNRGGWRSDAYIRYIEFSENLKQHVANRISTAISSLGCPSPAGKTQVWPGLLATPSPRRCPPLGDLPSGTIGQGGQG